MEKKASGRLRLLIVRHADDQLADWQAMLLDRLASDPKIDLVGAVEGQEPAAPPVAGWLLRIILAAERRIVASRIQPYDRTGARAILNRLPTVTISPDAPKADLALVMGTRGMTNDQLRMARYGAWSVTFAGASQATGVAIDQDQRAAAGMSVQILRHSADEVEPAVIRSAVYNQKPGAVLTGAFVEEKSVVLILRALHDLAAGQISNITNSAALPPPDPPGTSELLRYAAHFTKSVAGKFRENWHTKRGRAPDFWRVARGTGDLTDLEPQHAVALPALSHTMADPFLFENDGRTWVFYEAMNADDGPGWIDVAELDGELLKPATTALARPYHLSFPFVFRDGDDIYMMPETQQSRRLEVWRATDFPTKWELHATTFEGSYLADSTLWQASDQQWWLLTNISDHHAFQDHSSELYLFAVDGPDLKSITPHPGNPVAIGADHARNAGALIRQNGRLFRPSQNNSYGVYGYGLNLMEITRLDATTFEETLVRRWTPDDRPGILGIHHLSAAGDTYVFDWSGK